MCKCLNKRYYYKAMALESGDGTPWRLHAKHFFSVLHVEIYRAIYAARQLTRQIFCRLRGFGHSRTDLFHDSLRGQLPEGAHHATSAFKTDTARKAVRFDQGAKLISLEFRPEFTQKESF